MAVRDDEYVVCPHCCHPHGDAWEWCTSETPRSHVCDGCGQWFQAWAEYEVQYLTVPLAKQDGGEDE